MVFQQPDEPPTCGRHRLRKLSSCRPEVGRASQHPRGEMHCDLLILPPELKRLLRDIDHGVDRRAGDFVAVGAVADLEHCAIKLFGKTHDIMSQKTGFKLKRASLLNELVGYKAGRGHSQNHICNFAVFLVVTRVIKDGELGLGPQGVEVVPGDLRIFLHCSVHIPERLNSMTLPAKFLVDPVEALGPFPALS